MDHLEKAKEQIGVAGLTEDVAEATYNVLLAGVHVLIEIAERLPPPAEAWSACSKRLREEERDGV